MLYSFFGDDYDLYDVFVRLYDIGEVHTTTRAKKGEFSGKMIVFNDDGTQSLFLKTVEE